MTKDMQPAERREAPEYLVTPCGGMKKFDPKSGLLGVCGKVWSLGNVNE